MQSKQCDFLENGQNFPSVADWQAVLEKDADGVLSVCRKIGKTLPILDPTSVALKQEKIAVREEMERLLDALQVFTRRLPQPQGFFSSSEDRKKAHEISCCFLDGLEKRVSDLRLHDIIFSRLYSTLRDQEEGFLQAEAILGSIAKASKKQGADLVLTECQGVLEKIQVMREERLLFREDLKKSKEELQGFCQHTVPNFCHRIAVSADLKGEGREGTPQGVLQLFGELRHEVERILSAL